MSNHLVISIAGTDAFPLAIENVLLVNGLKHSLLSVSQLCGKGFLVSFDSHNCFIENKHEKNIKHIGFRNQITPHL